MMLKEIQRALCVYVYICVCVYLFVCVCVSACMFVSLWCGREPRESETDVGKNQNLHICCMTFPCDWGVQKMLGLDVWVALSVCMGVYVCVCVYVCMCVCECVSMFVGMCVCSFKVEQKD